MMGIRTYTETAVLFSPVAAEIAFSWQRKLPDVVKAVTIRCQGRHNTSSRPSRYVASRVDTGRDIDDGGEGMGKGVRVFD